MKITAITRYKHGELYAILNRLGWTQSELARRAGLDAGRVGEVVNLNKRPSQKTANAIQNALGEAGEYFDVLEQWPETFQGIKKGTTKEETMEVPMECLIGCREAMKLPAPEQQSGDGLDTVMDECLATLTERERQVIEARFYEYRTLDEVGGQYRVGRERVRQIEAKALRKLRSFTRMEKLRQFSGRW